MICLQRSSTISQALMMLVAWTALVTCLQSSQFRVEGRLGEPLDRADKHRIAINCLTLLAFWLNSFAYHSSDSGADGPGRLLIWT